MVQSRLEFNLAHFPFPPHIRTATFYAVSLSQSLSSVPVPVPLSLRSPFSLPSPQIFCGCQSTPSQPITVMVAPVTTDVVISIPEE